MQRLQNHIQAPKCARGDRQCSYHLVRWQDFRTKRDYSTYYLLTRNKMTATNSRVFSFLIVEFLPVIKICPNHCLLRCSLNSRISSPWFTIIAGNLKNLYLPLSLAVLCPQFFTAQIQPIDTVLKTQTAKSLT